MQNPIKIGARSEKKGRKQRQRLTTTAEKPVTPKPLKGHPGKVIRYHPNVIELNMEASMYATFAWESLH